MAVCEGELGRVPWPLEPMDSHPWGNYQFVRVHFLVWGQFGIFLWIRLSHYKIDLRFIIDDNKEVTLSRLAMITAFSNIIAAGLNILGVEPVTEM